MTRDKLNDAAIVLNRVFRSEGIKYGIFGGYAIGTFGGTRSTKDIDCLASTSKEQVLKLLTLKDGFEPISQSRDDYVAFLWDEKVNSTNPVLVEVFCEKFPGAEYSMEHISFTIISIKGGSFGNGVASFLDPIYLFKGKLHAAAARFKYYDGADLRSLASRYEEELQEYADKLNLKDVGIAVKRHPELLPINLNYQV
ncbi:hypothetical protein F4781DRAFT_426593 [Annulohypoxylon bovei var. microspora]|nr:hypothetical protein F4781DRAFT_426593 [Annulohypoxylon bovei var. microspora]